MDAPTRERILFVCTANVDRSRTAEDLYRDDPRYEVRSAGTAPFATTPLTRDLLQWAERVFVMEGGGDHGRLTRAGSVDDVRAEVERYLEGGREAFELRRRIYDR